MACEIASGCFRCLRRRFWSWRTCFVSLRRPAWSGCPRWCCWFGSCRQRTESAAASHFSGLVWWWVNPSLLTAGSLVLHLNGRRLILLCVDSISAYSLLMASLSGQLLHLCLDLERCHAAFCLRYSVWGAIVLCQRCLEFRIRRSARAVSGILGSDFQIWCHLVTQLGWGSRVHFGLSCLSLCWIASQSQDFCWGSYSESFTSPRTLAAPRHDPAMRFS